MHIRWTGLTLSLILAGCLSGCGGGNGSSDSTSSSASGTVAQITAYKGMFTEGTAIVKDAAGNTVASGVITHGLATVSIPDGTAYPITVFASGTYVSEATGAQEKTDTAIRSVIADATTAGQGIPVTALTEIAAAVIAKRVESGEMLNASLVKSSISTVASATLNMTYNEAMAAPNFSVTDGKTSDPTTLKLAALALASSDAGTGITLIDKLKDVASKIAAGQAPATVLPGFNDALSDVTGAKTTHSQQADPANATPIPSDSIALATYALVDISATTPTTMKWDNSSFIWDTATWK